MLRHLLVELDERLSLQVSAVIADPSLCRLERAWRELDVLASGVANALAEGRRSGNARARVIVKVLDATAQEVQRDISGAMSRSKTILHRHFFGRGLDLPGGQPVGLIVLGGEFGGDDHRRAGIGDIDLREQAGFFAWLGSECLAPVVMGMSPEFLAYDSFEEIAHVLPERLFHRRSVRTEWLDRLRQSDGSRFLAFTAPRILLRGPYEPGHEVRCGFGFRHVRWRSDAQGASTRPPHDAARGDDGRHLFGSAAFALAVVFARSFAFSNWFTYVRGVECGDDWSADGGGVFVGPCLESFSTDSRLSAVKPAVDAVFAEPTEERLGRLGITVLTGYASRGWSAFHSIPSFRQLEWSAAPRDAGIDRTSEQLASMVQYLLCACRVAHLVHRYGQTLIGSTLTARQLEEHVQEWLAGHQVDNPDTGSPALLKRPLRGVKVSVRQDPESIGRILMDIWLQPHSQFSSASARLHLVASVADTARRGGVGALAGGGR